MLNEELIHKQAEQFNKKDKGYIHIEMNEAGQGETILSGDPVALLFAICTVIKRISDITNTPVSDILSDISRVMCDTSTVSDAIINKTKLDSQINELKSHDNNDGREDLGND